MNERRPVIGGDDPTARAHERAGRPRGRTRRRREDRLHRARRRGGRDQEEERPLFFKASPTVLDRPGPGVDYQ